MLICEMFKDSYQLGKNMTTQEKAGAIAVLILAACGVGPLIGMLGEQIMRFLYTATIS